MKGRPTTGCRLLEDAASRQIPPVRIGIIGAARIISDALVRPAASAGAEVVLLASRDSRRAGEYARANGIGRVAASYADVVRDAEVEAVYVPLPNALHGQWSRAAIEAGKHVLSEKPFATSETEASAVHSAGLRRGVKVADGVHYFYHPIIGRLRRIVASGELGALRQVDTNISVTRVVGGDIRWSAALAGGAVMDLGYYGLHLQRMLAPFAGGEPMVVSARCVQSSETGGVDESAQIELRFPSGAAGSVQCSLAATARAMTCSVRGDLGSATVCEFVRPHLDSRILVQPILGSPRIEQVGGNSSYWYQLSAFTSWVRGGTAMPTCSADAVATMRLVDASYAAMGLPPGGPSGRDKAAGQGFSGHLGARRD